MDRILEQTVGGSTNQIVMRSQYPAVQCFEIPEDWIQVCLDLGTNVVINFPAAFTNLVE